MGSGCPKAGLAPLAADTAWWVQGAVLEVAIRASLLGFAAPLGLKSNAVPRRNETRSNVFGGIRELAFKRCFEDKICTAKCSEKKGLEDT